MTEDTFIQQCIDGKASAVDIDRYVDAWHQSESTDTLYVYLGMSGDEYEKWVLDSRALQGIIDKHSAQGSL